MNSSSKNTKEDTSENDISEFTNEAVFKGGLGLINTLQKDKDNPLPSSSPNSNPSTPSPSNTSPELPSLPSQKASHKILQGLSKQDTPPVPNSSMYSSGFISFRNKKANILPQGISTNNSNKVDDYTDPAVITQSILEKLNSIKPSQNSLDMNGNFFYNNESNYNTYNSNKTNYKSEQREIGKMFQNSNAFDDDNIFGIHNSSDEQDEEENKENVFLNIIKHHNDNNGIIVNEDNTNEEKEKYINTIVCTLSLLEKGKAIFVSKDDMIFVLPSLFVPKNLKVGNTYMFIVGEYENYHEKSSYIREIQKKYVNK